MATSFEYFDRISDSLVDLAWVQLTKTDRSISLSVLRAHSLAALRLLNVLETVGSPLLLICTLKVPEGVT